MKFSQTLALNSNPDWAVHYIDYAGLKKFINELSAEAQKQQQQQAENMQVTDAEKPSQVFLEKLKQNMGSIREFFYEKKKEIDLVFSILQEKVEMELENNNKELTERTLQAADKFADNGKDDINVFDEGSSFNPEQVTQQAVNFGDHESSPLLRNSRKMNKPLSKKVRSATVFQSMEMEDMQREICDLYTQYHNLKLFGFLNVTGLTKILKKYDKIMGDNIKKTQREDLIQTQWPFWLHYAEDNGEDPQDSSAAMPNTHDQIQANLNTLQGYFATLFCHGDDELAKIRMQLLVREYISFQRHSVWLDVIQDGRRREAATAATDAIATPGQPHRATVFWKRMTIGSTSFYWGIASFVLFAVLLCLPTKYMFETHHRHRADDDDSSNVVMKDLHPRVQQNAFALLVFVSFLWAAEVLPLFCTALLVPFLAVLLRVIVVDGVRLSATQASHFVFQSMFSHVILLLLGGFSIAAALSKHGIAKMVASYITQHVLKGGTAGMRIVLLVYQFIATIASMWISNVAAPVLCYTLMAPIFKAATAQTSLVGFGTAQWKAAQDDRALCRALVMGIALASNVGGMASPISSPQNLFAIEYTPIGWVSWFVVSIPLCVALNILIWAWLVYCFKLPGNTHSNAVAWALQRDRSSSNDPWTGEQYFVVVVSVGVVLLWCASVSLAPMTGEMGVLGIVPLVLFFGTGVLNAQDLNNFLWGVVLLAMGGLVLGEAVTSSGLLEVIAEFIALFIQDNALSLWQTLCVFTALILVCTTFVSHTVGAIVVLPICNAVGSHMLPVGHAKELVFAGALACSAAMGLPVSGFPNMTAVGVEDHLGNRFLTTRDFLRVAVPASIFSWAVLVTFGYVLISIAVDMDSV